MRLRQRWSFVARIVGVEFRALNSIYILYSSGIQQKQNSPKKSQILSFRVISTNIDNILWFVELLKIHQKIHLQLQFILIFQQKLIEAFGWACLRVIANSNFTKY